MEYITFCGFKILKADALSKEEAFQKFLDSGFLPQIVFRNYFKSNKPLSNKEAANFFESLGFLFRSTNSLIKSLHFLEERYDKTKLKFHYKNKVKDFIDGEIKKFVASRFKKRLDLTRNLKQKLESGIILSVAFQNHGFDEITTGLVSAAERGTGDFVTTFKKLMNYYATKEKYSKGLIKELTYPFMLILISFFSFLIFIFYVVPAFAKFFEGLNVSSSTLATINIFMDIRNYFVLYGFIFTGIMVFLLYLWLSNYRNIRGKFFEKLVTIPVIGYFFRFSYLKWYLYEFSVLISAGEVHSIIVKYLMDNAKNDFFKNRWAVAYLYLSGGSTLAESLNASDLLRPEDLDRLSAAEIGGGIDDAMMLISSEYEEIIDLQMKIINKSLNYIVLIFIAIFVVFIFGGIYLPMIKGVMSLSGR